MKILAIETSCDETAAAVVENGIEELGNVVSSSKELHESTGGIVPEVAARKQVEYIVPVIDKILKNTGLERNCIDAVAVTVGPGLLGSLLVGTEAARALAFSWNKPLIPVNHLAGHIYANFLRERNEEKNIQFPAIAMVVSGGHTDIVLMGDHGDFKFLGGTLDDAAGEAFDKTARILGIAKYLGGAKLSELASTCGENIAKNLLPRPMLDKDSYDFSFSGLKTAVKRLVETNRYPKEVIACEFENAVVDVLVSKISKAVQEFKVKSVLLGGGVSANRLLRERLKEQSKKLNVDLYIPPLRLCTDNAVYIASAAYFNRVERDLKDIQANSNLNIMDKV